MLISNDNRSAIFAANSYKGDILIKILALSSLLVYNEYALRRNTLNLKHCILVFISVYESEPK